MSVCCGFLAYQTHNPKVRGSNPLPATKDFKGLHRFGVSPFSLVGYFWALFLRRPLPRHPFCAVFHNLSSDHSILRLDQVHGFSVYFFIRSGGHPKQTFRWTCAIQ
jgi:hypothetical protein